MRSADLGVAYSALRFPHSAIASAVTIRRREMECVRQMPDFAHCAISQEDFNDVKTDFDLRILEQLQIIQTALGEQPALARVHRGGWAHPAFGRARLYFHEHETI